MLITLLVLILLIAIFGGIFVTKFLFLLLLALVVVWALKAVSGNR